MKKTLLLLSTILLFGSSNGQQLESPLKGIKRVKTIEFDTEVSDNDTIVTLPYRSIVEFGYDENGYMSQMIFSMNLKTKIPVYKVNFNGNDLNNLTESLTDSLNSTSFKPSDYLDFTNGNFDTTTYSFDKKEENKVYLKGSDGGVEIMMINGNYISSPNPFIPNRPNSIEKYDENGYLIAKATFGFQDTYYTQYKTTKSENGIPLEAFAIIETYQPKIIDEEIKKLNFSSLTPSQTRVRFVKFEYVK